MHDKLADLLQRKEQALQLGAQRSIERQHEKGKMLARERLALATLLQSPQR